MLLKNTFLLFIFLFFQLNIFGFHKKIYAEQKLSESISKAEDIDQIEYSDSYILNSGDELKINFVGNQDFSGIYKINPDGTINTPFIGKSNIRYFTTQMVEEILEEKYSDLLIENEIIVDLLNRRTATLSILGAVRKPGIYQFSNNSNIGVRKETKLVDLIKKAGGLTIYADIQNIEIIRRLPADVEGFKRARINLSDYVERGFQQNNIDVFDEDVVRINKLSASNEMKNSQLNNSLFADDIVVTVVGEVQSPGKIELPRNSTLLEAIMLAGGFKGAVSKKKVDLLRSNKNGKYKLKSYNMNLAKGVDNIENPAVFNGDIIKINTSVYGSAAEGLKVISEPAKDIFNIYGLYKLFND